MPLQQTTVENIVSIEEIAQDEQFLLLQQCLQLYMMIKLQFKVVARMLSKSSAADLLYMGKGNMQFKLNLQD